VVGESRLLQDVANVAPQAFPGIETGVVVGIEGFPVAERYRSSPKPLPALLASTDL
jgi:hypothetical protein